MKCEKILFVFYWMWIFHTIPDNRFEHNMANITWEHNSKTNKYIMLKWLIWTEWMWILNGYYPLVTKSATCNLSQEKKTHILVFGFFLHFLFLLTLYICVCVCVFFYVSIHNTITITNFIFSSSEVK